MVAQDRIEPILDELGNVTDDFQNFFFEALKQKGIENYDRAIQYLERAAKESPKESVVYFEMAKNYASLKKWDLAEINFNKAASMSGEKPEIYQGLYDVYFNTKNYPKAIETVLKLIPFDKDYKEDLANLYVQTEQYDKALQILDELDLDNGNNEYRNQLRQNVYAKSSNTGGQIEDLENRIKRAVTNEQDFLNLIYLYSDQGNQEKAFDTAKKLIQAKPQSHLAHLALYKFYIENNQLQEGFNSMQVVLTSGEIESDTKLKVLNDFLLFVNNNPQYEDKLAEMVTLFSEEENNPKVFEQLGAYYLDKKQPDDALRYFEMGLSKSPRDFNLIKNTLLLQLDFKKYTEAASISMKSLDFYPSQPLLYLLNGVANLNLNENKKAKESLETGLDFLIDDKQMERDFYLQLSKVHENEGNTQKKNEYAQKAQNLNN